MSKSDSAFRTISEVSEELEVPQHVLRFWETKFAQIRPLKRGGGRRYYRPEDITVISGIRNLLYRDGYTIKGVQKLLKEKGDKAFLDEKEEKKEAKNKAEVKSDKKEIKAGSSVKEHIGEVLAELKEMKNILDKAVV